MAKRKNHPGVQVSQNTRRRIYARDGFRCLVCGSGERLTLDHIVPRTHGGTNHATNLQTLCEPCNQKKGTRRGEPRPALTPPERLTIERPRHRIHGFVPAIPPEQIEALRARLGMEMTDA